MANSVPNQQTSISKAEFVGVHKEVADLLTTVRTDLLNLRQVLGDDGTGTKGTLVGTKNWTPTASLANGATSTTTITVTGVALGDLIDGCSHDQDLQGCTMMCYVNASNTVTVVITNNTGGAKTIANGNTRVSVCPGRSVDQGNMQNLLLSA